MGDEVTTLGLTTFLPSFFLLPTFFFPFFFASFLLSFFAVTSQVPSPGSNVGQSHPHTIVGKPFACPVFGKLGQPATHILTKYLGR